MTLVGVLADPARASAVVADSERLLEVEVKNKGGLTGAAVRTGFRTMKKIRPGIVPHALQALLPQFAPVVDPHYSAAVGSGDTRQYFTEHADSIANDLLDVTDGLAAKANNRVLLGVYKALRPQAKKHVAVAMPQVALLCDKHVSGAGNAPGTAC